MKDKIIPIASVAIGLLAFVLTTQYWKKKHADIKKEWDKVESATQKVEVMIATRNIPQGTKLVKSDIQPKKFYKSAVRGDTMTRREAVYALGRKTLFRIDRGDFLKWSSIEGEAPHAQGLASVVTPGMRAISISVSGPASVSGMVRPNDRVDVLGTFSFPAAKGRGEMETVTMTILQEVLVLATGQTMAKDRLNPQRRRQSTSYSTVSLEVRSEEAELLVFAQEAKGRLTLSLRNPTDVDFQENIPSVNFEHLQKKIGEYNRKRQYEVLGRTPGRR